MFPDELTPWTQWVLWRTESVPGKARPNKRPYGPGTGRPARIDAPATWGTYAQALARFRQGGYAGLAFVVSAADPYTVVDLDHCGENGQMARWAWAIVDHFASYTEWSPSHQGLHIWLRGRLPGQRRRTGQIELYDASRAMTMTGWHPAGTPLTIEERQEELERLYWRLFPPTEERQALPTQPQAPTDLSDVELIARALRARNGARFARLWQGDLREYAGDHSRADLALCALLAFWTRGDSARIDWLFRQSSTQSRTILTAVICS